MLKFVVGIFVVLHGLVHLLYAGQSLRLFELQPGLAWPDGSWAFSRLLGDSPTRWLASICCVLAAIAFVGGGVGIFVRQPWWRPVIVGASAFSSVAYLVFWNGQMQKLDAQGGVGLLINLVLLAAALVSQRLGFEF